MECIMSAIKKLVTQDGVLSPVNRTVREQVTLRVCRRICRFQDKSLAVGKIL